MTTKTAGAFTIEREIRIEAPRERVFQLIASRDEMRRWFRPTVFDPRIGGQVEFTFPFDGEESVSRGEITAYEPPKRLAFTWSWESSPGANTEVVFDLIDEGGSTLLRLTHTGFVDEEKASGHEKGWGYWMDRLATVAKGEEAGPDMHSAAERRNAARAALLKEELALKDHVEQVAAQRRALEMPDPLEEDYALAASDDKVVRLSELFGDKDELFVYHMMYHPDDNEACPMCSMWVDGFNAVVPHVEQRASFVVIGKAPIGKLRDWAKRRGWDKIRVLSSYSTTFNKDFHAEDADGDQLPVISVFRRSPAGVHHFYQKSAILDENNNRGIDLLTPVWNLFDLLPSGRGERNAGNDYVPIAK
ncbi:MAG: DUF899 family protein [Candidatus Eremiobacteraeota bacterium]|nr:DUF899 family protein [Candidatus Eremiobacteraeota bacterium]